MLYSVPCANKDNKEHLTQYPHPQPTLSLFYEMMNDWDARLVT